MSELHRAVRSLRKSPYYVVSFVLVLALTTALVTVVFAFVKGLIFDSLPYGDPEELYYLDAELGPGATSVDLLPVAWREAVAWRDVLPELPTTVVGTRLTDSPVTGGDYTLASIDEHFFDVLGVQPLVGGFAPADFETDPIVPNAKHSIFPVLISHRVWQREFGGDTGIVGRTIIVSEREGESFATRIAGILPPHFRFPMDTERGQPDALAPITPRQRRSSVREFVMIARVPTASADWASVNGRLDSATQALAQSPLPSRHGSHKGGTQPTFAVARLHAMSGYLGRSERRFGGVILVSALVLALLACVNLAGLSAARIVGQRRSIVVQRALGAKLGNIARAQLIEVAILVSVSTVLALVLSRLLLDLISVVIPVKLLTATPPTIDTGVVFAVTILGLLVTSLIAIWPVRTAMSLGAASFSRGGLSQAAEALVRKRSKPNPVLITCQVALAFVLLVAGMLTMTSYALAASRDLGYDKDKLVLVEAHLKSFQTAEDAAQKLSDIVPRLALIPGVDMFAFSTIDSTFARQQPPSSAVIAENSAQTPEGLVSRKVSEHFFDALGLRLLEGRWPQRGEWNSSSHVAIVSKRAAETLWEDGRAIGRTLIPAGETTPRSQRWHVIGIVADTVFEAPDQAPAGDIFLPQPIEAGRTGLLLHFRTETSTQLLTTKLIRELPAYGLRVERALSYNEGLFEVVKDRALRAWLFGGFALSSVVVVAIGVAGLIAMTSELRRHELAVRMAVGARRSDILATLVRQQMAPVVNGLLIGGFAASWTISFIGSLYRLDHHSPLVWAGSVGVMLLVTAFVASITWLVTSSADPARILTSE